MGNGGGGMMAEPKSVANISVLDDNGHIAPFYQAFGHVNLDTDAAVFALLQADGAFIHVLLGQLTLRDDRTEENPDGPMWAFLPDWFWRRIPPQAQQQKLKELTRVLPARAAGAQGDSLLFA